MATNTYYSYPVINEMIEEQAASQHLPIQPAADGVGYILIRDGKEFPIRIWALHAGPSPADIQVAVAGDWHGSFEEEGSVWRGLNAPHDAVQALSEAHNRRVNA